MTGARPIPDAPRPAATVMLLRDGEADGALEVLLLRRHLRSDVHGGVHVFPGGKVDEADAAVAREQFPDAGPLVPGFGDPLMSPGHAATLHVAAMRELKEECGIGLEGASLHPHSRWITPLASIAAKRFDTWFFVGLLPSGAVARHDDHEAVEAQWWRPSDALERYWRGEILLAPPQIMSLVWLSRQGTAADALGAARRARPARIQPEHQVLGDERILVFPGDPLHSVPDRALPGPTRLAIRQGRFEPLDGFAAFSRDDNEFGLRMVQPL